MVSDADAAAFVRSRLRGVARLTQDEMKKLIDDLKALMGRALTRDDVTSVVEVFAEAAPG
jgi:hypothetical protein